jgi:hypothetical protein
MSDSLTVSSVRTTRDYDDRIQESAKSGINVSAKTTAYSRSSTMERIEKVLSTRIEDHNQRHMPVSMLWFKPRLVLFMRICQTVMIMLNPLVQVEVGLARSTNRYNFRNIKMTREAAYADTGSHTLHRLRLLVPQPPGNKIPYFSRDNAHLMYNAHPKLFRHSF